MGGQFNKARYGQLTLALFAELKGVKKGSRDQNNWLCYHTELFSVSYRLVRRDSDEGHPCRIKIF